MTAGGGAGDGVALGNLSFLVAPVPRAVSHALNKNLSVHSVPIFVYLHFGVGLGAPALYLLIVSMWIRLHMEI
jgi:hypothetical protein